MWLRSGLSASQSDSSSPIDKPFLYGPCFVHGGIVVLKQERAFPKLLPQSWKQCETKHSILQPVTFTMDINVSKRVVLGLTFIFLKIKGQKYERIF
jgi:hypothetical protein